MATINGTSGNDNLTSTPEDDSINGFGGNDTINLPGSGYGDDVIDGGTGNDSLFFNFAGATAIVVDFGAGTATGSGTVSFSGIERVVATQQDDHLIGAAGAQNLSGVGGNDTLEGGAGNDWLWGGGGNDSFIFREFGSANADNFGDFASGTDKIVLDATVFDALGAEGNFVAGDVRFWAAAGATSGHDADDRIIYNTTTRQLFYDADGSGSGAAQLIATLQSGATLAATNIVVEGGGSSGGATEGDDVLVGTDGADTIDGLGGNDHISGLGGDDHLIGGAGNDFLDGGPGSDLLDGGTGDDTYFVRSNGFDPADQIAVDPGGVDTVIAESTGWTLGPGLDNLIVRNPPFQGSVAGNELDNTIDVEDGDPLLTVNGLGGNDTLLGSADSEIFEFTGDYGNDFVDGGGGPDTIVAGSDSAIVVDFAAGTVTGGGPGGSGSVTFVNVDRVSGGDFDDRFVAGSSAVNAFGEGGDDTAVGGAGDDLLNGGEGNDELTGGAGNDLLIGSVGLDRFIFDQAPGTAHADTVGDFITGQDDLVLDLAAMPALGSPGPFASGDDRFHAAAGATNGADAEDRVVYNTTTGQVFYDADGSGAGAALLIATLQSSPALAATDIEVIGDGSGEHIVGTEGDDNLVGTAGDDTIEGLGGNDTLTGNDGADTLHGGAGNDTLIAGEGPADIFDSVRDTVADTLDGGLGDDAYHVSGTDGDIILADPGGIDTVFAAVDWTLGAGLENLQIESLLGDGTGNELDNHIGSAAEGGTISGLGGNDTLVVRGSENGTTARGGQGNDTLLGDAGTAVGDFLFGDEGNDLLAGGGGRSRMTGGSGEDVFLFDRGAGDEEFIADFASGADAIRLDARFMPALGASGDFTAGDARFGANTAGTAQDASDRVVYNTSSGELWYDADGNGTGAAALIATLEGAPALAATDIEVVNGTAGGSHIVGTEGDDNLVGTNGDDLIEGLGGNDTLTGGLGEDELRGGDGNDWLSGAESSGDDALDILDGGMGDDDYFVYLVADTIVDAGGIDTVHVSRMDWTLGAGLENLVMNDDPSGGGFHGTGNELDNVIQGSFEGGTMRGMGGNDTLRGSPDSQLIGGDGNDVLEGGRKLFGDAGDDVLSPGVANFFGAIFDLTGGTGADTFVLKQAGGDSYVVLDLASGVDTLRLDATEMPALGASGEFAAGDARFAANGTGMAQDASDRVVYNTVTGELWYDADGNGGGGTALIVTLQGAPALAATDIEVINGTSGGEHIVGTSGNDTLNGTAGDDTFEGLGGNDTFNILPAEGYGNDVVDGGAGNDSLYFNAAGATAITADFGAGSTSGSAGSVSFSSIERIVATIGNDHLIGAAGAQNLSGVGGNDIVEGGAGNDWLWSGGGVDTFVFREFGAANADRIGDFASGSDTIALDNATMTALGADGDFVSGDARFRAAAGATGGADANDRVIYNTSTGQLYYDADGSGAGAAQLIATLSNAPGVSATDIAVI